MPIRSFLAFELPPEIKEQVRRVSEELKKSRLDIRWVKPENIHLTIVFLGDLQEQDISPIEREVEKVCSGAHPFDFRLKGFGVFPDRRRPRIFWVGLDGDIERVSTFKDALCERLAPFNIKEENRQFKPHLTLGRFKNPGRADAKLEEILKGHEDFSSPAFQSKELILFKSDLKPQGPVYTKLDEWELVAE
jgi:RNA 2',3'-cyclic 3'-phosphodiesterase